MSFPEGVTWVDTIMAEITKVLPRCHYDQNSLGWIRLWPGSLWHFPNVILNKGRLGELDRDQEHLSVFYIYVSVRIHLGK